MRRNQILAMVMVALSISSPTARAGNVLVTDPYDGTSAGVPSQIFTDTLVNYASWNTEAFADFTVTGSGWLVTGATFYGQDQGNPTQDVSVNMQILSAPGFTTNSMGSGTEDASSNLDFNNLNLFLAPGTYWITAWIDRPELTGGQWFWDMTNDVSPGLAQFEIQDPGAALLNDPTPTPGDAAYGPSPLGLAFTLYGSAVPEPSGAVLLAIGAAGLAIVARRSRARAARLQRA
jgi:hypothetical protein